MKGRRGWCTSISAGCWMAVADPASPDALLYEPRQERPPEAGRRGVRDSLRALDAAGTAHAPRRRRSSARTSSACSASTSGSGATTLKGCSRSRTRASTVRRVTWRANHASLHLMSAQRAASLLVGLTAIALGACSDLEPERAMAPASSPSTTRAARRRRPRRRTPRLPNETRLHRAHREHARGAARPPSRPSACRPRS